MENDTPGPLVVTVTDTCDRNGLTVCATPAPYLNALAGAGLTPIQLPSLTPPLDPAPLLDMAGGVLLTGSRSNVEPSAYGGMATPVAEPFDPPRDATAFALIRAALGRRLPLLAICRGLQELNVALGGTLHQAIHTLPGRLDHIGPRDADAPTRFAIRETVTLAPGGRLAAILGVPTVPVNSVHGQAIDRLADGLQVEATAADGTIEAVSVPGHPFALAVQWHPEYFAATDRPSGALFDAFAAAVRRTHERNDQAA